MKTHPSSLSPNRYVVTQVVITVSLSFYYVYINAHPTPTSDSKDFEVARERNL